MNQPLPVYYFVEYQPYWWHTIILTERSLRQIRQVLGRSRFWLLGPSKDEHLMCHVRNKTQKFILLVSTENVYCMQPAEVYFAVTCL